MAIKPKDVYKGRQKSHRTAKLITLTVVLLLALLIGMFFWLRQYAVYDKEGNATIVMPWSEKKTD